MSHPAATVTSVPYVLREGLSPGLSQPPQGTWSRYSANSNGPSGTPGGAPGFWVWDRNTAWPRGQPRKDKSPFTYSLRALPNSGIVFWKL